MVGILKNFKVYWVTIPDRVNEKILEKELYLLDSKELEKYYSYKFIDKKLEFLTGRILVKKILSTRLKVSPMDVILLEDKYGKLFVENACELSIYFNISHANKIVTCVVSSHRYTGIDVEILEEAPLEIMSKVYLPKEIDFINSHEHLVDRKIAFYLIWTRKEAFMKANGLGFYMSPRSFNVAYDWGVGIKSDCAYFTYRLPPNHLCSVALNQVSNQEILNSIEKVDFDELYPKF